MKMEKMKQGLGGITEKLQGGGGLFDALNKAGKIGRVDPIGADQGIDFDDTDNVFSGENPVVGIVVRCGHIVDGIGLLRKDGKKEPFHGSSYGGGEQIIRFDEGDGLALVECFTGIPFGGAGGAVSGLTFKTRRGKTYGPFGGGRSGSLKQLIIPENGEFRGFCGYAGTQGNGGYVAALGLVYEEK